MKVTMYVCMFVLFGIMSVCAEQDEQFVYSIPAIAEEIGIHPNVLRQFAVHGELQAKKIRNQYYVTKDEIERFFSMTNISQYDYTTPKTNVNVSMRSSNVNNNANTNTIYNRKKGH